MIGRPATRTLRLLHSRPLLLVVLTLGLTALAVRLGVGIPVSESTQIADLARATAPGPLFAAFQATTSLLLLAAASSSFQAGPGLGRAPAQALRAHERVHHRHIRLAAAGQRRIAGQGHQLAGVIQPRKRATVRVMGSASATSAE